jgi:hypothetical protein
MPINLNDADNQDRSVTPPGPYWVKSRIKPGGAGDDGLLRLAKNMYSLMLQLDLTILDDDEWRGKKIFEYITCDLVEYDYNDEIAPPLDANKMEGLKTSMRMGRSRLKAMINSAFNLMPNDDSDEAKAIRNIESYNVFNDLCFMVQIEVKPAQGNFKERNVVDFVIEPGDPAYSPRGKTVATRPSPKPDSGSVPFDDELPY